MSDANKPVKPKIRRARFISLAYVMPLVAVVIAIWLVWRAIPEEGPEIILEASDAEGISPERTMVRYRGIDVGEVKEIQLSDDYKSVNIRIQFYKNQDRFAQSGARFWIVKPKIRLGQVSGLTTLISGRFIAAQPGHGKLEKTFHALDEVPVAGMDGKDLQIELFTPSADPIEKGSNIVFRDMKIGVVNNIALSNDSSYVSIDAVIFKDYARLVRSNSMFWKGKAVNVNFSLQQGLSFDMNSFESLLNSEINMATPTRYGERTKNGAVFSLHDKPEEEWLIWNPKIPMQEEDVTSQQGK